MIKVDFWSDEKVGAVGVLSRLLFIGTWTLADDSGVCRAHPVFLKNHLFPYDEKITKKNIEDSLSELVNSGLIAFIDYQGETYIFINNFSKHQQINRPSDHRFIDVDGDDYCKLIEQSMSNHGGINGKVKEKVKEKVKVKENINHAKNALLKVWNENLEKFKAKYPLLDYDLQRDLMLQWIEDTPKKSLKKSNWNLFIQNWLSRSRRVFSQTGTPYQERIRVHTEPVPEPTKAEKIQRIKSQIDEYRKHPVQRFKDMVTGLEAQLKELE